MCVCCADVAYTIGLEVDGLSFVVFVGLFHFSSFPYIEAGVGFMEWCTFAKR